MGRFKCHKYLLHIKEGKRRRKEPAVHSTVVTYGTFKNNCRFFAIIFLSLLFLQATFENTKKGMGERTHSYSSIKNNGNTIRFKTLGGN